MNERVVLEIFQRLHKDGLTIVMVTHDPHVGMLADHRIGLERGRVVPVYAPDLGGKPSARTASGAAPRPRPAELQA